MRAHSTGSGKRRRGSALVVIFLMLVPLTVLVLAYFAATQLEAKSAAAFSELGSLRRLSEIPLEIVEEQIREATLSGGTNAAGWPTRAWTSQPGLMRVIDASGALAAAYKLYSSEKMQESSMEFLTSEIPPDWRSRPEDYVNLNRPARSHSTGRPVYPVLNPSATNHAWGLQILADASGTNDAAMPVAWLYVLEDGSIVPRNQITATNLPVGRIAFWADDESCKVNLNTAGERVHWDRPRAGHVLREQFQFFQPSTGEYNAYPGHPATVSLSAVFGKGLSPTGAGVERMLSLTPRYAWGGSENATLRTYEDRVSLDRLDPDARIKNDRLIPTEDEAIFNVTRGVLDADLAEAVAETGFLTTVSSRSPELNLWGMPRVGLWPVDTDPGKQTVYDRLIARCLTIAGQPYHFRRSNPHAMDEANTIPRNRELLDYLDRLTTSPVPGHGGRFSDKYGEQGSRQILTQIFDFIRSGVNLSDTSVGDFNRQFTPANTRSRGYVLPTKIDDWGTRGFGRLPVLTHVGIVLYAHHQRDLTPPIYAGTDDLETDIHAMLWFNFINPMLGVAPVANRYKLVLRTSHFEIRNASGPPGGGVFAFRSNTSDRFSFPNDRGKDHGGYEGMPGSSQAVQITAPAAPLDATYEFHSVSPVVIRGNSMEFSGGPLELEIWDAQTNQKLQTYTLSFPNSTAPWPVPLPWHETNTDQTPADDATLVNPLEFSQRNPHGTFDTGQNPSSSPSILVGTRRNWNHPLGRQARDVVRSLELKHGDARIVAALENVPADLFQPAKGYFDGSRRIATSMMICRSWGHFLHFFDGDYGKHVPGIFHEEHNPAHNQYGLRNHPPLPAEFERGTERIPVSSLRDLGWAGDIDGGWLGEPDGPWLNKPDEGFIADEAADKPYAGVEDTTGLNLGTATIRSWDPRVNGFFSPTRQIPSAVQLGSLPTGIDLSKPADSKPWQTLVFSPNSQAAMVPDADGNTGHPGDASPPDYLLLDLFTMPVVEPYALSEPFSAAGKINLNQRLIPFTHIRRETGLHAVLRNLGILGVEHRRTGPGNAHSRYSKNEEGTLPHSTVDVPRTLDEIAKVLDPDGKTAQGVFRSATEICDVFLIPDNLGSTPLETYWRARQFTTDNTREAPYNAIYPLLTTQSNTFLVHYLVQSLKPLRSKPGFTPSTDFKVTGQLQGSYAIERYLDEKDPRLDPANPTRTNPDLTSLNDLYRFRILRHERFTPGQ